jgi:Fe-Mn family superoxide dismutase
MTTLTAALAALAKAPSVAQRAAFSSVLSASSSFALPPLPYDPAALEPFISADIMRLHHGKHHAAYVTNLNAALDKYASAAAARDVAAMIALQPALRFNGGGHVNHSIFWANLAPPSAGGGGEPAGALGDAVKARWGSFAALKAAMVAAGAGVQGSGWAWLGYNKAAARLEVVATANQDPLSTLGLEPILGIDVWEHAVSGGRRGGGGGARAQLLPPVQERAPRLPQRHLERRQLE